ncbi:MAG: HD domain-containing protein [Armatimonadota bacterium]
MKIDWDSVVKIAEEYDQYTSHVRQVADIAMDLFDNLSSINAMGEKNRDLLKCAALLHDLGWSGGQQQHHKRSRDIILSHPPKGLSNKEVAIVANVARYHRKGLPKSTHSGYSSLSILEQQTVRYLAAILRIADGLDRTHRNMVRIHSCNVSSDAVIINIICRGDCSYELEAALKKADLFEQVFNLKVKFKLVADRKA